LVEVNNLEEFWYKLYADDLVLTIPADVLSSFLLNLKPISQKYKLKINEKKSGIFLLNSRYDY
jgi:hypothetical protein